MKQNDGSSCGFFVICLTALWLTQYEMDNSQALQYVNLMRDCTSLIGKHFMISGNKLKLATQSVIEINDDVTITKVPLKQSRVSSKSNKRPMILTLTPEIPSPRSNFTNSIIKCSVDDDSFMYFDLWGVPAELFCFFHERIDNKIGQPPFNHHSINHSSIVFRNMFEAIRNGTFDDTSRFHFVMYNIKHQSNTEEEVLDSNSKRRIQQIELHDEGIIDEDTTCTHFSYASAMSDDLFEGIILRMFFRLTHVLSATSDLTNLEKLQSMDKVFINLCKSAIKRGLPKEEIFMANVTEYESFFHNSTEVESNSIDDLTYNKMFVDFQRHVHRYFNIRLGTLEGIHRLYGISYIIDNQIRRNNYIRKGQNCRFTNLRQTSSEVEWNEQILQLKNKSTSYERKKSLFVPTSRFDIMEGIMRDVNKNSDVIDDFKVPTKKQFDGTDGYHYFASFLFPILKKFIWKYLKVEALGLDADKVKSYEDLKKRKPIPNNPIIQDCIASSEGERSREESNIERFWSRLLDDSTMTEDSTDKTKILQKSFNIRTLRFGNHFRSNYRSTQHIKFLSIFRIVPGNSKAYRKQHYTVHAMRNLLISIHICKFCRNSFIRKAIEANQSHQKQFNDYLNTNHDSSEKTNLAKMEFHRVFDVNLIGKYKMNKQKSFRFVSLQSNLINFFCNNIVHLMQCVGDLINDDRVVDYDDKLGLLDNPAKRDTTEKYYPGRETLVSIHASSLFMMLLDSIDYSSGGLYSKTLVSGILNKDVNRILLVSMNNTWPKEIVTIVLKNNNLQTVLSDQDNVDNMFSSDSDKDFQKDILSGFKKMCPCLWNKISPFEVLVMLYISWIKEIILEKEEFSTLPMFLRCISNACEFVKTGRLKDNFLTTKEDRMMYDYKTFGFLSYIQSLKVDKENDRFGEDTIISKDKKRILEEETSSTQYKTIIVSQEDDHFGDTNRLDDSTTEKHIEESKNTGKRRTSRRQLNVNDLENDPVKQEIQRRHIKRSKRKRKLNNDNQQYADITQKVVHYVPAKKRWNSVTLKTAISAQLTETNELKCVGDKNSARNRVHLQNAEEVEDSIVTVSQPINEQENYLTTLLSLQARMIDDPDSITKSEYMIFFGLYHDFSQSQENKVWTDETEKNLINNHYLDEAIKGHFQSMFAKQNEDNDKKKPSIDKDTTIDDDHDCKLSSKDNKDTKNNDDDHVKLPSKNK